MHIKFLATVRLQINCEPVAGCFKLHPQTPRVPVYSILPLGLALVEKLEKL